MTLRLARRPPLTVVVAAVAVVALLALLAYGVTVRGSQQTLDDAVARGERPPAPALALPSLDGARSASLAGYRGKVVVVNYWASWCLPCRDEAPLLQRWHERLARRGGVVLGVDSLDVTGDARAFVRGFGLTYPMLRDRDGATQRRFGVSGYPETVVVDRAGRIAALRRGPVDDAFLRRTLPPLLEERA